MKFLGVINAFQLYKNMAYIKECVRKAVSALVIDNPPINALSSMVVQEMSKKLEILEKHPQTEVIVLMGKNDLFSAGADIKEFEYFRQGQREKSLDLTQFVDSLDQCKKPIVAYIRKFAFGGGLELALGCHYRVVHESAKLGLPEVRIGMIPGAQGTQRLPRLIPLSRAIDMIIVGRHIYAKDALELNLVDKSVSTDGAMYDFAESVVGKPFEDRRVSGKPVQVDKIEAENILEKYQKVLERKSRGLDAPLLGLEAVSSAVHSASFQQGVERESELFHQAMTSNEARSMQYIFTSQKKASRLPSKLRSVVPENVQRIAVVGGGLMGTDIATAFLTRGFPVLIMEKTPELTKQALATVMKKVTKTILLGRAKDTAMVEIDVEAWMQGVSGLSGVHLPEDKDDPNTHQFLVEALERVDLVVEAVYENMDVKKAVFKRLDRLCRVGTFLASNTSTLDIDELASVTKRPGRVCGLHFFTPAYHMPIVEVVQGQNTRPATIATMHNVCRKMSKIPVITGNCFGFCGNRMLLPYICEAISLVLAERSILDPHTVDQSLEDLFGMRIGPFRTMDLVGMDVMLAVLLEWKKWSLTHDGSASIDPEAPSFVRILAVIEEMVKQGRLGRKTGMGWYKYDKSGGRKSIRDPDLLKLIAPFRHSARLEATPYPEINEQREIVDRCVYCLINEGMKILEEQIVPVPETIDTVWISAYGWPKSRGGPIFYARNVGLNVIHEKVEKYSKQFPQLPYWKPAQLLANSSTDSSIFENWKPNTFL